jgi:hypothetical protein
MPKSLYGVHELEPLPRDNHMSGCRWVDAVVHPFLQSLVLLLRIVERALQRQPQGLMLVAQPARPGLQVLRRGGKIAELVHYAGLFSEEYEGLAEDYRGVRVLARVQQERLVFGVEIGEVGVLPIVVHPRVVDADQNGDHVGLQFDDVEVVLCAQSLDAATCEACVCVCVYD